MVGTAYTACVWCSYFDSPIINCHTHYYLSLQAEHQVEMFCRELTVKQAELDKRDGMFIADHLVLLYQQNMHSDI